MNEALSELIGQRVKVWSEGMNADAGVLEAFDHPWVRLRRPDGRAFCYPIYSVRLVEPVEAPARERHLVGM